MGDIEEVALSQLHVPAKQTKASNSQVKEDEIPLNAFVKKEKKSKSKNTAESDQRKKKKKKKRKLESSVDGEHKKAHKKKKKEHKAEAITVKNETNVDEVKNHDPEGLKSEIEDM
ncbi:hypothetical protein OXX59_009136, partial [Metschnikowia pulcherrima]